MRDGAGDYSDPDIVDYLPLRLPSVDSLMNEGFEEYGNGQGLLDEAGENAVTEDEDMLKKNNEGMEGV